MLFKLEKRNSTLCSFSAALPNPRTCVMARERADSSLDILCQESLTDTLQILDVKLDVVDSGVPNPMSSYPNAYILEALAILAVIENRSHLFFFFAGKE